MCMHLNTHKDMHGYSDTYVRFEVAGKASFSLSRMITVIYYKSSYSNMILLLLK